MVLEMVLDFPANAYAYTDPNLGNVIFQVLFPIITGISVGYLVCKNYLKRKFASFKKRLWEFTNRKSATDLNSDAQK